MSSSKNLGNSTGIVFFGNEELATGYSPTEATILSALLDAGYKIELVILKKSKQSTQQFAVEKVASTRSIPLAYPRSNGELTQILHESKSKIGVLVAYGKIVPSEVINSFEFGIVNIHPSILPKYRGSTPIETTILSGDQETGISLMQLEIQMDAGPIYAQQSINLDGHESKQELCQHLAKIGAELLINTLPRILSGELQPHKQSGSAVTFTHQITKQDGLLRPNTFTAIHLERQIRAYQGWPTSYFFINSKRVIVLEARSSDAKLATGRLAVQDGILLLGCKEGSLELKKLKPEGKNDLSARELINSLSDLRETGQQKIDEP